MKWKNIIFCKEKAAIKKIYCEAFGKSERMPWGFMLMLSCIPTNKFRAFYENEKLCGFMYYGVLGRYLFVMFFSVKAELRCCGYGSRMLTELRKQYPNHQIIVKVNRKRISEVHFSDWQVHAANNTKRGEQHEQT